MIVTIDGPAGTGKSTVARQVAEALGFEYLDTGAMYRVVALLVLEQGAAGTDAAVAAEAARRAQIAFREGAVLSGGRDVTEAIRRPAVSEAASFVAQHPAVRAALVEEQRRIANQSRIVCEGRDQGTVVFPFACCKFYLTADPEIRAQRRWQELAQRGEQIPFDELLQQILERDRRDAERTVGPLRPAEDAVIIDTGPLTTEQVVERILTEIRQRLPQSSAEH
jgi:cytidylate kinase